MKNLTSAISAILSNNNVSNQEETINKTNKEIINAWYAANGHLLEEEITEVDFITGRDAVLIKQWFYNVEGTNTGKRISPKFNQCEESHTVSKSDVVADEMVVDTYFNQYGKEVKEYDRGGVFGAQYQRHQQSITSGEYSKHFRNSHFEDGLCPGQFHATDERGNFLGFMSTEEYSSWKRSVKAETRADVEWLEKRQSNSRELEVEMRDYARKVYGMIYNRIVKQLDNYKDIKAAIYNSQRLVLKALKRRYPNKITARGGLFIYKPVKYGTSEGNLTNMNVLFHKVESNKLWKAVDESKWKQNHLGKLEAARAKFNRLMSAVSITNNPYDQADLISSNKIGVSKQDAQDILSYAASKTNQDRLSYPVYKAVLSKAA